MVESSTFSTALVAGMQGWQELQWQWSLYNGWKKSRDCAQELTSVLQFNLVGLGPRYHQLLASEMSFDGTHLLTNTPTERVGSNRPGLYRPPSGEPFL